jgi:Xaa-Pro aminopeptidase
MNTRYNPISSQLFIKNRTEFITQMQPNSIAFFNSNDIYPISADTSFAFVQHSDIYYLCGIDQEETQLILYKDEKSNFQESLFIKKTGKKIAIWEGQKITKKEATKLSGIKNIFFVDQFDEILKKTTQMVSLIYLNQNEHERYKSQVQTKEDRFANKIKTLFPTHKTQNSFAILQSLRVQKKTEEIQAIQTACNITEKGFRRVLPFIKPNVWEYEIEAEFSHEFIKNGADGFAYQPIVASGRNACVLHYTNNNQKCKSGELILLDVAAKYAKYSSDMTRTIPVSGKFLEQQRKVYQAVLTIKKEAEKLLYVGNTFAQYNKEIGEMMTKELLDMKLLKKIDIQNQTKKNPAYKKYYMHGTSHFLGLDTHDYGDTSQPFKENMVLTIEPGIYIPKENMGIRLEDNYVIQKNGNPINLMKNIPIEMEDIEGLMNP